MRWVEILERPIISYIVMGIFSSVAAVLFFNIGGSVATVTGEDNSIVKAGFEAGGAIAGFIIIFVLSLRVFENLHKLTPEEKRMLREYIIRSQQSGFNPGDHSLACKYKLYDTENGGWWPEWKDISYIRAAGGLKIIVNEMKPKHLIRIRIEDRHNQIWESEEDLAYGVSPIFLNRGTNN
jgi:hypothetical protein